MKISQTANTATSNTSTTTTDTGQLLPAVLSLIAGMVDVTGWLVLSGLFTAHITGNLVVGAADLVRGVPLNVAQALAIPVFICAVAVAGVFANLFGPNSRRARIWLFAAQTLFLVLAEIFSLLAPWDADHRVLLRLLEGMTAVTAMAVQNAALHVTRKSAPTTAVMTGNIVVATIAAIDRLQLGSRPEAHQRWAETWPLLAGFSLGCLLGAFNVRAFAGFVWVAPAIVSLLCLLWYARSSYGKS